MRCDCDDWWLGRWLQTGVHAHQVQLCCKSTFVMKRSECSLCLAAQSLLHRHCRLSLDRRCAEYKLHGADCACSRQGGMEQVCSAGYNSAAHGCEQPQGHHATLAEYCLACRNTGKHMPFTAEYTLQSMFEIVPSCVELLTTCDGICMKHSLLHCRWL